MRIITYQSKEVVDILLGEGKFKITDKSKMRTYNSFSFGEAFNNFNRFKEGYDYIFNRTRKKTNNVDYDNEIVGVIWGWYRYQDIKELDNDNIGNYCIELEIDAKKVLLSDFDYYENVVIAGLDFVYDDRKKAEEIYKLCEEEVFKHYDKMIDGRHLRSAKYIQASFWKINKCEVVSIREVK